MATDIARILDYDPGALVRALDKLEARGLITRQRNKRDRRMLSVQLREESRPLLARIEARYHADK